MDIAFPEALLLLGLVLAVAAGLSGWLGGTVLSISVLSVGAGLGLSSAGVLSVEPGAEIVLVIVELALILTLFSDGLFVEDELLQTAWRGRSRAGRPSTRRRRGKSVARSASTRTALRRNALRTAARAAED